MKYDRGLIVKTKFSPPSFHSERVVREQILSRCIDRHDLKLTLVCAPAGYGKTSLMVQYYEALSAAGKKVAWLSLDRNDADLSRFFLYLVYAIKQIQENFGESLLSILQSGFSEFTDVITLNFYEALHELEQPVYLFIDDYHLAERTEIDAAIRQILLSTSPLQLIISSRHQPTKLPVSRLRMLRDVNEVDQEALRFSYQESKILLEKSLDAHLLEEQSNLLVDKTEGWAAGMQLASIAMQKSQDTEAFVRDFSGEHRNVGEFLGDEIIDNLPPELSEFVIKCSALPRFNYQLCEYVFGCTKALDNISQLKQDHIFIVALDDVDYWYRFHHLFSQYLRKKLHEHYANEIEELHAKASHWHENHGFINDAIEHALESEDHFHAADLLDKASADLFYQGKIASLEQYAKALSPDAIKQHPSQQLDRIWQWVITWQFDKAKIALGEVRETLDLWQADQTSKPDTETLKFLESKYAHREMSYAFFSDRTTAARVLGQKWLDNHLNTDFSMVASAKTMLMVSERDHFVVEDIQAKVDVLHDLHVEANFSYGVMKGDCLCGATLAMTGDLDKAEMYFDRARSAARELHGDSAPLTAMPCLQLAELYYERDQLSEASELIDKYLPLSQSFGFAENIIAGYLTKARLEFCKNNSFRALQVVEEGRKAALATGFERLRAALVTENIRQLLLTNDTKSAFSLARAVGIAGGISDYLPEEGSNRINAMAAINWARVNAAMASANNAIRLLTHWHNFLKERQCIKEALRFAIILADIYYTQDDPISGHRYLSYSINESIPRGFCRIFADEGPNLSAPIKQIRNGFTDPESLEAIDKVIATYKAAKAPKSMISGPAHNKSVEISDINLSDRELEILSLAQNDKSNSEIALSLSLTEGTVKWHWQNIFSKLGVRRRRQAVIIASDMGLIN